MSKNRGCNCSRTQHGFAERSSRLFLQVQKDSKTMLTHTSRRSACLLPIQTIQRAKKVKSQLLHARQIPTTKPKTKISRKQLENALKPVASKRRFGLEACKNHHLYQCLGNHASLSCHVNLTLSRISKPNPRIPAHCVKKNIWTFEIYIQIHWWRGVKVESSIILNLL